jgi:hypothetical protein
LENIHFVLENIHFEEQEDSAITLRQLLERSGLWEQEVDVSS